jgi:hypothetical protein
METVSLLAGGASLIPPRVLILRKARRNSTDKDGNGNRGCNPDEHRGSPSVSV